MSDTHVTRQFTDVAIDATGEIVTTNVEDARLVSLNITADGDADYSLDVSADNETWFDDEATYLQADVDDPRDIRDVFELTDRFVRVRVTSAAAGESTADVTIQGVK